MVKQPSPSASPGRTRASVRFLTTVGALVTVACGASFDKIGTGSLADIRHVRVRSEDCLQLWIDNATPDEVENAQAAVEAVCAVLHDPKFEQAISELSTSWTTGRENDNALIPPKAVLAEVRGLQSIPTHLIVGPVSNANATSLLAVNEVTKRPAATAGEANSRPAINIDPERIAFWRQGNPERAACLVDTIAHELTHLIPNEPGQLEQKYQDRSKSGRGYMVSYSFGHAAGCFQLGKDLECAEMLACPGT